ncbi:hypothetical protein H6775_00595 [Candidatus Nomurabacteria bacterium]|nr:hypothetical protein [Candidatus Nomurabacteria bacterium]
MSLHQIIINIKPYLQTLLVFLIVANAFLFGQFITKTDKSRHPVIVISGEMGDSQPNFNSDKLIFASKSGTKYYYVWCSGSSRVKEENKVWFSSKEEATSRGYEKAKNCPGD